jgi:serine protease Do
LNRIRPWVRFMAMSMKHQQKNIWIAGWVLCVGVGTGILGYASQQPATHPSPTSRPMISSATPRTTQDLEMMESQIIQAAAKVMPSVVSLLIDGNTQGSGVIVSTDGLILTAAHVTYDPGKNIRVILYNGRVVSGRTLGVNRTLDAGMVKITGTGTYQPIELTTESSPAANQWSIALGHSGGYQPGRSPPLRLGRVLAVRGESIFTSCTLVSGDSGGPLFDLSGRLIGIHSRIGMDSSNNLHISISAFRDNWDRLLKGDSWGAPLQSIGSPVIDAPLGESEGKVVVGPLLNSSAAYKNGLRPGDRVVQIDNKPVTDLDNLLVQVGRLKPGDFAVLEVQRGESTLGFKVPVTARE